MDITQVKGNIAEVANQLIGANYFPVKTVTLSDGSVVPVTAPLSAQVLDALNPTILTDIGNTIQNFQPALDMVFQSLIDQLGKIVIDQRLYVADLPDIFVDPIEWGGFVEWVRVGLADVMDDPMWNPDIWQKNYNDPIPVGGTDTVGGGKAHARKMAEIAHATYLPKVRAKVYKEGKAIMVALSRYKNQMFTAFKSWDEQNRFESALLNAVTNTLRLKAKCFAMGTIMTAMGSAIALNHSYNLLQEAHNRGIATTITTASGALNDDKFKAFALEFIQNTKDNMREMTASYNDGVDPTFTPSEDNRLLLNAQFANNLKYSIRANTFNEALLGIGDYKKVATWQAINDTGVSTFDFDTVTSIYLDGTACNNLGLTPNVDPETEGGTDYTNYKLSNVLAFMYDRQGIGVTLDKQTTTTQYSAPEDKINTFWHGLFNYVVNTAYNMAVFYVADHTII